jgi:hypothetical protein
VTLLDSCGVPDEGACSSVTTDGIITVEQTYEYEDREEFFQKNGDGVFCAQETTPPILKWINLVLTFCNVDPEMVNIMTASPLVLSDADEPVATGFRTRQGTIATANFGLEGWNRVAGTNSCDGSDPYYLYNLWPWVVEGTMGDLTFQNGLANFIINGRTKLGSGWGVGPYSILSSEAAATLGDPLPLASVIDDLDHHHWQLTKMAPPISACGCTAIPIPIVVTNVGLVATLVFPAGTLPVDIDWGDLTVTTHTSGVNAQHTYAAPGTYTVTMKPRDYSSASYVDTTVTVA